MIFSVFYGTSKQSGRVAFPVAVAFFFLICHGLLGASHVVDSNAPSLQMERHDGPATTAQHEGSATSPCEAGTGFAYASVITVFLTLGLAASLSRLFALILHIKDTKVACVGFVVTGGDLIPCRGPTLPALQVFRL